MISVLRALLGGQITPFSQGIFKGVQMEFLHLLCRDARECPLEAVPGARPSVGFGIIKYISNSAKE